MNERMPGAADGAPQDELAGRVGTALRELLPDRAVTPGLVDQVQRTVNRRRRNRRDLLAAGSVLVCVLAVVVGLVTLVPLRGNRFEATATDREPSVAGRVQVSSASSASSLPSVSPSSSSPLPPAPSGGPAAWLAPPADVDRTRAYLRVVPSELPPEGGEVALLLADPTGSGALGGLAGRMDRWDGVQWQPYRSYSLAVGPETLGALGPVDPPLGARALGVPAPAHGFGEPRWLRVPPLEPGRYRFVDRSGAGPEPAGVLVVRSGAGTLPVLRPSAPRFLTVAPIAARPAARLTLRRTQRQTLSSLPPTVTWIRRMELERFDSGVWSTAGWVELSAPDLQQLRGPSGGPVTLTGLDLDVGVYRLTLHELGPGDGIGSYSESGVLLVLPEP